MSESHRPAFLLANAYGPGSEVPDRERLVLWTKFMRLAAMRVYPDRKPCSYRPWLEAFEELGATPAVRQNFCMTYESIWRAELPGYGPEWIDFALTFLECDVMLFRSGYAKRRFIHRLTRLELSDTHLARCEPLLRRAVTDGAGTEEFIEYCAMAARLDPRGLADWLLTCLGDQVIALVDRDELTKTPGKLHVSINGSHLFGMTCPRPGLIDLATRANDPGARVQRNASRMLWAILRRRAQLGTLDLDALPFPFSP